MHPTRTDWLKTHATRQKTEKAGIHIQEALDKVMASCVGWEQNTTVVVWEHVKHAERQENQKDDKKQA
ncbi:hypothetical protein AAFF_G00177390 [Aldrovandia affinis]|uniref:Uncharacterized protein n=1 Tax=Aldrovandia affinis TaxID=143900 RepID=A0AAD7RL26_9TELE|nr:hypothetical protein AAFF_G00177390 [Aldrovandia affinis]